MSNAQHIPKVAEPYPVRKILLLHTTWVMIFHRWLSSQRRGVLLYAGSCTFGAMSAAAMSCKSVGTVVRGLVTETVIRVGCTHMCARGGNGVPAADRCIGQVSL